MKAERLIRQINRESRMKFKKKPRIRIVRKHPLETVIRLGKNGCVKDCVIRVPRDFKRHKRLLRVVLLHELRSALYTQNHPELHRLNFSHGYSLLHEKRDLKKNRLSQREYERLTRRLGYDP